MKLVIRKRMTDEELQSMTEIRFYILTEKGKVVIKKHWNLFNSTFNPWKDYSSVSNDRANNMFLNEMTYISKYYELKSVNAIEEPEDVRVFVGRKVNKYINVLDEEKIFGVGSYKIGKEIPPGEYYFWDENLYVLDGQGCQIHRDEENKDFYLELRNGRRINVIKGAFTEVKNIEYSFQKGNTLELGHMYRCGLELPLGAYSFQYSPDVEQTYVAFAESGQCSIKIYRTYPASEYEEEHSKWGMFYIDENCKYLKIFNGKANYVHCSSEKSLITKKILDNLSNDYYDKIESQSMIVKGNRFYFYVSVIEPIAEIYIVSYYKDCEKISSPYADDATINYRFSVPKDDKDEICFVLYLYITKKIGLPMLYGVPINELYMYISRGYAVNYKNNDICKVAEKIKIKDKFSFDKLFRKLEKKYPAKLLLQFDPIRTYTMTLSPGCDTSYYYYTVENEKKFNHVYKTRLDYLAEKGLINVKWKSEFSVYLLVKNYYADAEYQYRAEWLGKQSLDVFIPSINTAIEYQGIQHYEAIDVFDGEDGLKSRIKLDIEKREKCKKNNVLLIEWRYDLEIKEKNMKLLFSEYHILLPKKKSQAEILVKKAKEKDECKKELTYIVQYSLDGKIKNKYNTVNEASYAIGVSATSISKVLRGERNTAGGYIWKKYTAVRHIPDNIDVDFDITLVNSGMAKKVAKIDERGNTIEIYTSIADAIKKNNISEKKLHDELKSQEKWIYLDDD
jgi:hypothetical protein